MKRNFKKNLKTNVARVISQAPSTHMMCHDSRKHADFAFNVCMQIGL
jgi:hypothetical protein